MEEEEEEEKERKKNNIKVTYLFILIIPIFYTSWIQFLGNCHHFRLSVECNYSILPQIQSFFEQVLLTAVR
jgi:hypothetical protein